MDLNLFVKINIETGVFHIVVGLLWRWKFIPRSWLRNEKVKLVKCRFFCLAKLDVTWLVFEQIFLNFANDVNVFTFRDLTVVKIWARFDWFNTIGLLVEILFRDVCEDPEIAKISALCFLICYALRRNCIALVTLLISIKVARHDHELYPFIGTLPASTDIEAITIAIHV